MSCVPHKMTHNLVGRPSNGVCRNTAGDWLVQPTENHLGQPVQANLGDTAGPVPVPRNKVNLLVEGLTFSL